MAIEGTLDVKTEDGVRFVFTVTNAGNDPETLSFRSGFTTEFVVLDDGAEKWRFSDGRMFTQALQSTTLAPGESTTFEGAWPEPEPGDYTAVATLQAEDHPVEARADFTV